MMMTGYDHLVIRGKDIEEGIHTYRDALGFTLECAIEHVRLGIKQDFFNLPGGGLIGLVSLLSEEFAYGKSLGN